MDSRLRRLAIFATARRPTRFRYWPATPQRRASFSHRRAPAAFPQLPCGLRSVPSDLPAINLTATGAGGVIPSGTSGNCYISGGTSSAPSWGTCGSGSGTVNPATQYYFPYYSAAGSATTLSGVGCSSTGFLEGSSSAAPTCVPPTAFPNLTAYSSPASGDLLLIGSAANSYATDQITLASLFGSTPAIGINTGALSAPSWTTSGLAVTGTAATLTDTSSSGTVANETAMAFPAFTIAASSATTFTALDELYLPAPVAGTNVTATEKYSLYAAGQVSVVGNFYAQSTAELESLTNANYIKFTAWGTESQASWTTNGFVVSGTAQTLTDTTASGTVATEAFVAWPAYTLAATNTSVTVTNEDEVYLPIPLAGTNVTATNKWSLHTAGGILDAGQLYDTALSTGTNADFICLASTGQFLVQSSSCTISSRRFKTNIRDLLDASPILRLDVKSFQMKQTAIPNHDPNFTHPQVGLIAENVAAVVPECAVYENDMRTPKSYRPECIMALGVKVLQDHQRVLTRDEVWLALLTAWCALLTVPYAMKLRARQ